MEPRTVQKRAEGVD